MHTLQAAPQSGPLQRIPNVGEEKTENNKNLEKESSHGMFPAGFHGKYSQAILNNSKSYPKPEHEKSVNRANKSR